MTRNEGLASPSSALRTPLSRRSMLKGLLAAGVSVPAAATLLDACGTGQSSGGSVTLTVWTHTFPPMNQLMKKLIAEYEKKHSTVHIKYQILPNDQFATKMLTTLSAGTGPDIINMDDGGLRGDYIPKHLIVPVDPKAVGYSSVQALKDKYIDGAFVGATGNDGKLYGLPLEYDAEVFSYNATQFQQVGLDPHNPPKTWNDVSTMGKRLVKMQNGQMIREGFDFIMLHSGWDMNALQLLLHQTGGKIWNKAQTASVIAQPAGVQSLAIWNNLINRDRVGDPHIASNNSTVPYIDLYTGKLSMTMFGGPWAWAQMQQSTPQATKDIWLSDTPTISGSAHASRCYGYYMAVNHTSKQQEEAWKFIGYVTSQHDQWISVAQFVQPIKGWQNGSAAKKMEFVDVWKRNYDIAKFDEVGPQYEQVADILDQAIGNTILNGQPPQQTFSAAQSQITQALGGR